MIVVDDGSTDNTRDLVTSFRDARVRYVYQENRGLSAARNTGIQHTTGPLVTFLDSDDLFLPEKLDLQVQVLETNPEIGLVAGQAILIDEDSQPLGEVFETKPPDDGAELLLGNPFHVGSVMLRRVWLDRVGLFDEELRSYEDWDLWLRLARAGCRMAGVDQPVSLYRFHSAQMTRNGTQMTTATFAVLDKIFSANDLPNSWRARRDLAYSSAHLRAAAQAYHAQAFPVAKEHFAAAVDLNPELGADGARSAARQITAWTYYAKTRDPLAYLQSVYDNLPDSLAVLRRGRRQHLAQTAIDMAFRSYQRGDRIAARVAAWHAFRLQPHYLMNRGAVSLFVRSWLPATQRGRGPTCLA
jgi:hypothetical protein